MVLNSFDQLKVNTSSRPMETRSAPATRQSSPKLRRGADLEKLVKEVQELGLLAPRTFSLPNCSNPQLSLTAPVPASKTQRWPRGAALMFRKTKPAWRCLKTRSCASASNCFPLISGPLRHHNSLDSAALARDFFGQQQLIVDSASSSSSDELDAGGPVRGSPTANGENLQTVTSSPLLRLLPEVDAWKVPESLSPSPAAHLLCRGISLPACLTLSPQLVRRGHENACSRSPSLESCSGKGTEPSSPSSYFRLVVLGDEGVGKSTLVGQVGLKQDTRLRNSGRCSHAEEQEEDESGTGRVIVNVDRNQEHCTLEIFDSPLDANIDTLRPDAFIVMYSVSDRKSFLTATDVTHHLRCELGMDRPVFLVANKTDLRRQQRVTAKEARDVAEMYDCCFMETSAALRMNVDALVERILDQIMQQLLPPGEASLSDRCTTKPRATSPGRALQFLSKLFRQTNSR